MSKQKSVAVYCRVSTNDQHVETQIAAIGKFCAAQGWTIIETYKDIGISGAKDSRPALDQLKKDCLAGNFSSVVVYKFDRMARSVSHLLECLELFRKYGIDFVSISEGIDTGTSVGKMVFTFLGAIAEFERSLITERVNAGIARAKTDGTKLGRPRKGFDVAEALRLKNGGLGYKQIALKLGVPRSSVHRCLKPICALSQNPPL